MTAQDSTAASGLAGRQEWIGLSVLTLPILLLALGLSVLFLALPHIGERSPSVRSPRPGTTGSPRSASVRRYRARRAVQQAKMLARARLRAVAVDGKTSRGARRAAVIAALKDADYLHIPEGRRDHTKITKGRGWPLMRC
jgi:hypothetical protein